MKIVMFSINPIYQGFVTGGASKHLFHISKYLGASGHEVIILCTKGESQSEPFSWQPNVKVIPILNFKQPFPGPYNISPGDLAYIAETVSAYLSKADRFYMHDGELLLPFLHNDIPTVISYRDNTYPESILGSFISAADAIIAVSDYSASVLSATMGRLFPDIQGRIKVINNGIDPGQFYEKSYKELLPLIPIDPIADRIILHPHRPERGKGLLETIEVVKLLVNKYQIRNLKVLIPEWLPGMSSNEDEEFYRNIQTKLKDNGLEKNFIFHKWLSQDMMPAYYSLGDLTLSLGYFIEAFGNVAYESLACKTPSIVAKVEVHRTNLPDDLIHKVDYGDYEATAKIAAEILSSQRRVSDVYRQKVLSRFAYKHQMEAYEDIILNCKKQSKIPYKPIEINQRTIFSLAPWCYISQFGIYHDYKNEYLKDSVLRKLLDNRLKEISFSEVKSGGGDWKMLMNWYKQTYLIPAR